MRRSRFNARLRLSVCLGIAICLTASLPTTTGAQDATPAATPSSGTPVANPANLVITSQDDFGSDAGQALSLSPDGRSIALSRSAEGQQMEDQICAYPTVTREAPICASFSIPAIAADSVAWSPDSTRFAFTEDLPRQLIESDIWVFDRIEATVVNLTDEGVTGDLLDQADVSLLDLAPAWSSNGEQIAFARTVGPLFGNTGEPNTTIQRISADGGEPTQVATASDQALAVVAGIRWPADDTILYSVLEPRSDATDGLWTVAADGGEPVQILATETLDSEAAILVDVSVGGLGLLLTSPNSGDPLVERYAIVDPGTGDVEPVTIATDQPVPASVTAAGFSPDGGSLLMAVAFPGEEPELIVRDLETGEDTPIGELDKPVGAPDFRSGLDWGENGFVLIPAAQNTSLLLTVEYAD